MSGQYCWYEGELALIGMDPWICIDIEEPVVVPPEVPAPVPGETDSGAEITLPDGTTIDAAALTQVFVGLKQTAWQGDPYKTLWGVRTDGLLVGLTYDKDEDVWAWHRHPMSNGAVVSIAVIPSATTEQDELWAVIRRTINGSTRHYIERMTPRIEPEDENDKDSYNFLDSSLSYSGAPATNFSGASHLALQTCRVWADGIDVGGVTVAAGGTFSLPNAASVVKVGIHTTASLVSLPQSRLSTERHILAGMKIRFYETLGGQAGDFPGNMDVLQFRTPTGHMDDSPPLSDADYELRGMGGRWSDRSVYTIQQHTAGPMTIIAAFPDYRDAKGG